MSQTSVQSSILGTLISRYSSLMRALGRGYKNEIRVLISLDSFLAAENAKDLTPENFSRWCFTQEHLASGVRRYRMLVVRKFCLYRRRTVPSCFVPDKSLFPPQHQYIRPYLFTGQEIAQLLSASDALADDRFPFRCQAFRLAVVLLYTTGMRRGELVRLAVGDYDPAERTVLIRSSKFHKSRCLPLATDGAAEVDKYLRMRAQQRDPGPDSPLIWHGGGSVEKGYTGSCFGRVFTRLLKLAKIRRADGRFPRVHDVRHSFAVNALLRWYRSGADVQAKLPLLSCYMGHVSIVSTEYYLHFIPEIAALASARFAEKYGALVAPAYAPDSRGGAR